MFISQQFAGMPVHVNTLLDRDEIQIVRMHPSNPDQHTHAVIVGDLPRFRFQMARAGAKMDARLTVREGIRKAFPDLLLP